MIITRRAPRAALSAPLRAPTPKEVWEDAQAKRDALLEQARSIKERLWEMEPVIRDAKFDAVTAIPCPYCEAPVGERCAYPVGMNFSPHFFHGTREGAALYGREV